MRIEIKDETDLENALAEIHRRASAYEGPQLREFIELASLSAPVESDDSLPGQFGDVEARESNAQEDRGNEVKERFEEALSMLLLLAFPSNPATEQAVLDELNEVMGDCKKVESLQMLVGSRKYKLKRHLGRRPTKRQIQLRNSLLALLPTTTQEDL